MNNPRRVFFIMLCGITLSLIISGAGIFYAHEQLTLKSDKIGVLMAESEVLSSEISAAKQAKMDAQKYAYVDALANKVVPSTKNQSSVILELDTIAKDAGIKLNTFSFQDSGDGPSETSQTIAHPTIKGVYILPIESGFTAQNFQQFITFLKVAEQNRRKVVFTNLNVSRADEAEGEPGNDGKPDYEVSFTLGVYVGEDI